MSRQGVDWKYKYDESQKRIDELEQENARLKEQVEEQRGYAVEARRGRSEYGALADKFEAELAVMKEENRAGTNALKLSGQALSKALDDVEKLLAENKRLVDLINGDE